MKHAVLSQLLCLLRDETIFAILLVLVVTVTLPCIVCILSGM
jgi:hypothetical protein